MFVRAAPAVSVPGVAGVAPPRRYSGGHHEAYLM
jgi:hypothetical protein